MHRDAAVYDRNFHTVDIVPGSRLAGLYPEHDRVKVNSIHHQAHQGPGARLRGGGASATRTASSRRSAAPDRGKPYLAAVQWHPEFHQPDSDTIDDAALLADFLAAARATRKEADSMSHARHPQPRQRRADRRGRRRRRGIGRRQGRGGPRRAAGLGRAPAGRSARPASTRFRDGVVRDLETLAVTMTRETGKPIRMSRNELNGLLGRIDFFVGMVEPVTATETVFDEGGMKERIEHVPLGVVGNISAWNYPWFVGCNVIVPALLTGNAVLYKPSEYATLTGLEIARLLHEAGVPRDVFVPLVGAGAGRAPRCWRSGSTACSSPARTPPACASRRPWARASSSCSSSSAARTRPMSATMPTREAAAQSLADGAMYNTGQSCCSVERIYVHEKIHDAFVAAFVETVQGFKVGDPMSEAHLHRPASRARRSWTCWTPRWPTPRPRARTLHTGGPPAAGAGQLVRADGAQQRPPRHGADAGRELRARSSASRRSPATRRRCG